MCLFTLCTSDMYEYDSVSCMSVSFDMNADLLVKNVLWQYIPLTYINTVLFHICQFLFTYL